MFYICSKSYTKQLARFNNFEKCVVIAKVDQKFIFTNSLHGQCRVTQRKEMRERERKREREREYEGILENQNKNNYNL